MNKDTQSYSQALIPPPTVSQSQATVLHKATPNVHAGWGPNHQWIQKVLWVALGFGHGGTGERGTDVLGAGVVLPPGHASLCGGAAGQAGSAAAVRGQTAARDGNGGTDGTQQGERGSQAAQGEGKWGGGQRGRGAPVGSAPRPRQGTGTGSGAGG